MPFAQYDVVKVKAIFKDISFEPDGFNQRVPRVGDIATIVEVYSEPAGYELECCDTDGITEWLLAFKLEEIELDYFS